MATLSLLTALNMLDVVPNLSYYPASNWGWGERSPHFFMSGLPVPNDWDETSYCFLVAKMPDSPLWRAMARGALYSLSFWYKWDKQTGDQDTAAAIAFEIFDSVEVVKMIPELQFLAMHSATQNVTEGTLLQLGTAQHNKDNQFDTTNYIWTVPEDGVYEVGMHLGFEDMIPDATISMWATVNDTDLILLTEYQTFAIDYAFFTTEKQPVYLQTGDEVKFYGSQSNAPTPNETPDLDSCKVWAYKVA